MSKRIFVNLPVEDLKKSMEFFKKLGFDFNMQFTDDTAACLVLGENLYAMLLTKKRFKDFTRKEIVDAHKNTEVLIALDAESRESVDEIVEKALKAGAYTYRDPSDYGWMYERSFADLDGHQWEIVYMDETAVPEDPSKSEDVYGKELKQ